MQTTQIAPFQIIGISVRTTNEKGKAALDIGQLWAKFMSEGILEKIPNKLNDNIFQSTFDFFYILVHNLCFFAVT